MKNHVLDHRSTEKDIDKYIETLTHTINDNIDTHVTKIKIKPEKIGLPQHIRDLIKEKHKIRKQYQDTRNPNHKRDYNRLNKQIKSLIRQENQTNWEKACNDIELKENQFDTWDRGENHLSEKCTRFLEKTIGFL